MFNILQQICISGETPFQCQLCHVKFKTRNTYKRHLRMRHEKNLTMDGLEDVDEDELQRFKAYSHVAKTGGKITVAPLPSKIICCNAEEDKSPTAWFSKRCSGRWQSINLPHVVCIDCILKWITRQQFYETQKLVCNDRVVETNYTGTPLITWCTGSVSHDCIICENAL